MAQQSGGNVPQIRFQGFEGEWADKPIGEVLAEKKRPIVLKDRQRYELITVKRRNEGVVSRGHLFGRDILVKNYSQLQAGDFVISKRQVVHGATGIIPQKLDGAIVSNEYLVAVNSSSLLTEFLTILASLPDMRQKFFLSSYGVDIEKLFFDAEDWKKRNVTIPGINEQTQIGEYFRELDSLIGLHQRKHDKLVTLKKAMLQKMFPQPGTSTPEIRFKGFEGDWKPCELGEITTKIGSGKTPRGGKTSYLTSGIPLIRSQNIFSDSVNFEGIVFISDETDEEMSNSRVLQNDVLLNITGASIGRSAVYRSGERANVNQHVCIIRASGNHHSDFIQLNLASTRGQAAIDNSQAGGAREGLNFQQIGKFIFQFPSHTEQQKIGTYFRTLDALISKHATQLQKLQQLKSACLEKMFV